MVTGVSYETAGEKRFTHTSAEMRQGVKNFSHAAGGNSIVLPHARGKTEIEKNYCWQKHFSQEICFCERRFIRRSWERSDSHPMR
jgi:hypothetical protein